MSSVRILAVEHEHGTGPERFGTWLAEAGAEVEVVRPYRGEDLAESFAGLEGDGVFDALIVLGGSAGPLDDIDNPWFPAVRDLLTRSAAGGFPSLNICLGGELLAAAAGAAISRRTRPQIGVYGLRATSAGERDPVFSALAGAEIPAVLFHQEEMALPTDAALLVTGSDAPVQAFRLGEFAWGTQFHPETDAAQIERWLASDPLRLPEGKTEDSIRAEVAAADAELVETNRRLAHSFVDFLRTRRGTGRSAS
ncbi:type 1 glutamine amidotransferase [Brevibacterium renqingii]|uniref:type 1 glutamine amidotransferase n=1 Tax=Brevibacterium renqingii TaxID=2776916 RepID=UPI001AE0D003|nr:type 1 glutamine amidotransferase [Brevibacterium renqingii]